MADRRGYSQTGIELLYQELAKRGIGPGAASGAIAGIMGESGANLDPTSFNSKDPGGGSGGIGQWNRDRLIGPQGMLAFAKNSGVSGLDINTPTDAKKVPLAVQTQYLGHELDTKYAGVASQLRGAATPQDALNIWINSYENPLDKAGAIAQRSQYLAPVGAALRNGPAPASGPIDPSIIARGGVSPAIPETPGTTINTAPAGPGSGVLPGFASKEASDNFIKSAKQLDQGLGFGGGEQGQQSQERPPQMGPPPMARNVSQLLPMSGQYSQAIQQNAATPLTWQGGAPGQNPYGAAGQQSAPIAPPYGLAINSMSPLMYDPSMGYAGYV